MSEYRFLRYEPLDDGRIVRILLDRPDTRNAQNRGLLYCSISGYGQTGPYAETPAYDLIVSAQSGLMSITGEPGRVPVRVGVALIGTQRTAALSAFLLLFPSFFSSRLLASIFRSFSRLALLRSNYPWFSPE